MLQLLHRLSLRTRISLMTLAIVLAGLWGLTFFASSALRKDMPDFIGQQQESAARLLADDIEREVQRLIATLNSLATHVQASALQSGATAQAFLASHGEAADMFNGGIVLYGPGGVALADTMPGAGRLGHPPADRAMLGRVMDQGAVAFSKPQVDTVLQSPQIGIAVPVRNSAGIVVGAVVGFIQLGLPNFLDPIRQGHYGRGGDFSLLDAAHRVVVTASDPQRILASLPAPGTNPALDRFVDGAQGPAIFVNELGTEVQAAVRQVPTARWLVLVALPTATAFAPVAGMQAQLWLVASLIALLTWLLTHWLLGRHMAPALAAIDQLTQRMAQVDTDTVAEPLEVHRTDEIGRLITAFNHQIEAEAQRKAMLREVLNTSNVGIFAADGDGNIRLANDTMGRLFGRPAQSLVGMSYYDIVAASDRPAAQRNQISLLAQESLALQTTRRFVRGDGTEFWGQVAVRQFQPALDRVRGIVGVVTDISAEIEIHDYELFRRRTLELLARNTALPEILEAIVRGVEGLRPQALCSILIVQGDGKHLAQGVAPSLPADYNAAIEGLEIGPYVGSCGAAAYSGERVVAQDLQTHGNWAAYRELAARAGLGACWSQPLLGRDGATLGTIAIYHRTPQAPLEKDVELIEQAAHLASLAIAQHRDAQAALESEERFRRVMETSPSVAVRGYQADGTVVFWNRASESLYGYSADEALGRNLMDLIFPADSRSHIRDLVADFFARGEAPPAGELQLVTKGGRTVTVFSSHALLLRDNHPSECFCMDVDLSEREQSALALRDSEARYRAMIECSPHPMAVHRDGRVVYVNPSSVAMMGAPDAQALLGQPILDFVHPESRALVLERARQVANTGQTVPVVSEKYLRLDGATIEVEAIATHIVFDGMPSVLVSMQDVTGRNQANQRLLLSAQVFDHAREGIMVTDANGLIVEVNAAFTRITGYERSEVLGRNPRLLNSGRQGKDYYATMWQTLVGTGNWTGEAWNRRKSGEIFAVLQTISSVRDDLGQTVNYVSLFSDVTAAKEHAQYIERIAHYDALTNLPNRVLLADRLQQAMKQAQRRNLQAAVAFLDLDGFKSVNDLHGHDVGDELLLVLAQRMRKALRESDTLARLGGDEFVAVIVDLADPQACVPLLARLLEAAAEPVVMGERTLQVTASVGVAFYPQAEDVDADQLLRQADQAMYQAKLAGKNRYHVFDAEQDRHVRGHHESLDRIRAALAHREFVLHYQPKVNMRTGQVLGAEALIRWQHPEQGLLAPASFLPAVEDNPLGVEIGQWVLEDAIGQLARWNASGLDFHVSVNIGARQLQQPQFVEHLRALLAAHPQLNPHQLELEVLETSALEDLAHVSRLIQECADMGVSFALDDFGTGYSSLSYLKRLPASVLKIDQSFVRDMLDDPDDLAILDGVIGLASAFRREVIAEGVETEDHGTLLLQLGCELGQGFGIARPMEAERFAPWAHDWQPHALWRQTARVHREDFALLYVVVEHRAWCNAVAAYVRGETGALSHQMLHECRFGRWLNREGARRYGQHPLFVMMDTLHERMHSHVAQLHRWTGEGRQADAQQGLAELMAMQEKLAGYIQRLLEKAA